MTDYARDRRSRRVDLACADRRAGRPCKDDGSLRERGCRVDFVLVEIADLVQHLVQGAGLLADADHLYHHVGENPRLPQGLDDRLPSLDAPANTLDRVLDDPDDADAVASSRAGPRPDLNERSSKCEHERVTGAATSASVKRVVRNIKFS